MDLPSPLVALMPNVDAEDKGHQRQPSQLGATEKGTLSVDSHSANRIAWAMHCFNLPDNEAFPGVIRLRPKIELGKRLERRSTIRRGRL